MKDHVMKPLAILILEDEIVNSKLLQGMLEKTFLSISRSDVAKSLSCAFEMMDMFNYDVVLLDLNLPDSKGLETLITFGDKHPDVVKVVVTGEYDDQLGIQTLAHGAQEYLIKGKYDVYTLGKSIQYAVERKRTLDKQANLLEELENVNDELKDFAYIISHDLKAPLRGISTLANWISEDCGDKLGEEGKEQMNLLLTRVERMHDLIEGVLSYSRVGRIKEDLVEINLNKLLPEVIDMIAPPESISVSLDNELPVITAEKTRILQLFQNLISNAVKYMDKPQGKIQIGCDDDGEFWKLKVADNGSGIDKKHFEKIFKIFQTVSASDSYNSTGVGLSVVKKIVEMYGGNVWVESEVGSGSTFFFTFRKIERISEDAQLKTITAY